MINDGRKRITDDTNEAYCVTCCSYILVVDFYFSLSRAFSRFFFIAIVYAGFFSMTKKGKKKKKKNREASYEIRPHTSSYDDSPCEMQFALHNTASLKK